MPSAQDNAIELARLGQELDDHKADGAGHAGYRSLSTRITTMEQSLAQIKYTAYGIALVLVYMATGLDLGKLAKLIGL